MGLDRRPVRRAQLLSWTTRSMGAESAHVSGDSRACQAAAPPPPYRIQASKRSQRLVGAHRRFVRTLRRASFQLAALVSVVCACARTFNARMETYPLPLALCGVARRLHRRALRIRRVDLRIARLPAPPRRRAVRIPAPLNCSTSACARAGGERARAPRTAPRLRRRSAGRHSRRH